MRVCCAHVCTLVSCGSNFLGSVCCRNVARNLFCDRPRHHGAAYPTTTSCSTLDGQTATVLYWSDSHKDNGESALQKKLAEEKRPPKIAEDRLERYQRANGRFLNYMVKEFVLPHSPPQPELGKKKAPICLPHEEAAAAPERKALVL